MGPRLSSLKGKGPRRFGEALERPVSGSLELLVVGEEAVAIEPAQLLQRLVLDLADALATDLDATSPICHR